MNYEKLVKGDNIYYVIIKEGSFDKLISGDLKMEKMKVLDVRHEGDFYIIETDVFGDMKLTLEEYFERDGDVAYGDDSAFVLSTTVNGFKEQLKKVLFSEEI